MNYKIMNYKIKIVSHAGLRLNSHSTSLKHESSVDAARTLFNITNLLVILAIIYI